MADYMVMWKDDMEWDSMLSSRGGYGVDPDHIGIHADSFEDAVDRFLNFKFLQELVCDDDSWSVGLTVASRIVRLAVRGETEGIPEKFKTLFDQIDELKKKYQTDSADGTGGKLDLDEIAEEILPLINMEKISNALSRKELVTLYKKIYRDAVYAVRLVRIDNITDNQTDDGEDDDVYSNWLR